MKDLLPKIILSVVFTGGVLLVTPSQVFASSNLSLSPSALSVEQNKTFTVQVRENSGATQVNAVQANLTYDATKLDFVSLDSPPIGTQFTVEAEGSGGGGSIRIVRAVTPPPSGQPPTSVTGDQLVATVTFTAKAGSGSTTINFTSGSAVVRKLDNKNDLPEGFSGGGTVSFTSQPLGKVGDLNGDGLVNIRDFGIFLGKWGTADPAADFNKDGTVNIRDFGIFLGKWGT